MIAIITKVQAGSSTFKIESTKAFARQLSPVLHSIFFETEINFGSEGGLYAETVFNRDFETLGRGTMPKGGPETNPVLPKFTFLFDGCCRGGPASSFTPQGSMSPLACASKCEANSLCNAVEVDGCLADPTNCGGQCWHFTGNGNNV